MKRDITFNSKDSLMQDESYGLEGEFFITICVNSMDHSDPLSNIKDGEVELTKAGKVVEKYWYEIARHFANVTLKDFVIMPNHIHGIISIGRSVEQEDKKVHDVSRFEVSFGLMIGRNNPFMLKGSIFHIIAWYKAASLIEIKRNYHDNFSWKPGYFDFCIENPVSLRNIRDYISNDPCNWDDDLDNPANNFRDLLYPDAR